MRFAFAFPLLGPLAFTSVALLPVVTNALVAVWNLSIPGAATHVSELPTKPPGSSVDTEQGSLDVWVDWDDVNGAADYLVNQQLRAPCQELNNGVRGATGTNYFLKVHPAYLPGGVDFEGA